MKKLLLFLFLCSLHQAIFAQNKFLNLTGFQVAFNFGRDYPHESKSLSFYDLEGILSNEVVPTRNIEIHRSSRQIRSFYYNIVPWALNASMIFKPYNFENNKLVKNFYSRFGVNYLKNITNKSEFEFEQKQETITDTFWRIQRTAYDFNREEINLEGFFFLEFAPIKKIKRTKIFAGFGSSVGISVFNQLHLTEREWDAVGAGAFFNPNYLIVTKHKVSPSFSFKAIMPVGISIGLFKKWALFCEYRKIYYQQRFFKNKDYLGRRTKVFRSQTMLSCGIQYDLN